MGSFRITISVAASAIALLVPRTSFAQRARPQQVLPDEVSTTEVSFAPYLLPADRVTEHAITKRPNRMILKTGAGVFALAYGASVIAGLASSRDADNKLFIPVVGPWLDLGDRRCTVATPCGTNEDLAKAMIVASGLVQAAGFVLAVGSLFVPESSLIIVERTKLAKDAKPKIALLPISFADGAGVAAVGRF